MKVSIKLISLLLVCQTTFAQYYYKDILAAQQAADKEKIYRTNGVKSVELSSKDGNDQAEDGFVCEQHVVNNFMTIITYSKSKFTPESFQTTLYNERGLLKRTIDTSKSYSTSTDYQFDDDGRLINLINTSIQTDNQLKDVEEHRWQYDKNGKPFEMMKIKNGNDTTFFHFVIDEKGNVAEERSVHNKIDMPTVFYYYNTNSQLTDIVRYNAAAKRLLPDFIFTYDDKGVLTSMIVVPEGSSDYQKWVYKYNDKGLKLEEMCFNKRTEMLGKIIYHYNF